jgi:hypothetical protein
MLTMQAKKRQRPSRARKMALEIDQGTKPRRYSKTSEMLFMRLGPESAAMLAELVADRQASMPDHHIARAAVVREAIRSLHEAMTAAKANK